MYRGILHTTLGYRCENVLCGWPCLPHQHVSQRGLPRLRRAPGHLGAGGAHGCVRGKNRPGAARVSACATRCMWATPRPPGRSSSEPMGTPDVLEKSLERSDFARSVDACSRGRPGQAKWYGIGLAYFGHGSGFTGDGESRLKSKAALDLEYFEDGRPGVSIRISSTEMGQGTLTIMPQIAADGLSIARWSMCACRWPTPSMRRTAGRPWPRAPPWWWAARCLARR
jgi:hypothetical protein